MAEQRQARCWSVTIRRDEATIPSGTSSLTSSSISRTNRLSEEISLRSCRHSPDCRSFKTGDASDSLTLRVIVAQLDDGTLAYLGARITAKSVLDRNSRILRIVYHDHAFDTLDDTVITFGEGFDWIAWHGVMIVLDAKDFHAMFRDIPALVAQVDANVATHTTHVGIDNLDAFRARDKGLPE